MADIFLSYASEDRKRAALLASALEDAGWTVWWDREVKVGEAFDDAIEQALAVARCVMPLWTRHSINSRWVKNEAMFGMERGILVPVLLDHVEIPVAFRATQAADLRAWKSNNNPPIEPLVNAVSALTGATIDPPVKENTATRGFPVRSLASAIFLIVAAVVVYRVLDPAATLNTSSARPYLLVVPFDVSAPDVAAWEPFSDQITREIIRKLRKISGLRVVPHPSAFVFKTNKQRGYISEVLPDVEYVLDGQISVTGAGALRITTELEGLVGASSLIWDGDFITTADSTNLFAVQTDIAREVSRSLEVAILDHQSTDVEQLPTRNLDAYRIYVDARDKQRSGSGPDLVESIRLFDAAIRLDEDFALAYAGKADSYRLRMTFHESPAEMLPHVISAATRAIVLEPESAEVRATLGLSYLHSLQWEEAFRYLNEARAMDPEVAPAHHGLALYYSALGERALALEALAKADELDPLNAEFAYFGLLVLLNLRQYDMALKWADQKADLHSEVSWYLAMASSPHSLVGNHERAIQLAERGVSLDPANAITQLFLAQVLGRAGQEDRARATLAIVEQMEGYICPYETAAAYVTIGEYDRAFDLLLNRAVPNRSNCLMLTRQDPRLDPLRDDNRFRQLLGRIGLDDDAVGFYRR